MTNGSDKPNRLKEIVMSRRARDTELCSAGEEDEFLEVEIHSPTDSSEDSVEVKVSPIFSRNKRKCAEPRKVGDVFSGPLKKRMCLKVKSEHPTLTENPEPFRPWNAIENKNLLPLRVEATPLRIPNISTRIPHLPSASSSPTTIVKLESSGGSLPLPLIARRNFATTTNNLQEKTAVTPQQSVHPGHTAVTCPPIARPASPSQPLSLVKRLPTISEPNTIKPACVQDFNTKPSANEYVPSESPLRVPLHPHLSSLSVLTHTESEHLLLNSVDAFPKLQQHSQIQSESDASGSCGTRKDQRNYKNMTRERRIEANARERTRVHTISAAFDTLRRSVPAYSHNQKLSKLSVLRIACSYIMTLSNIMGNSASPVLMECVDNVSRTIQKEGKLRKKKEENE